MDDSYEVQRVQRFLEAMRAAWLGTACLTDQGAEYLGVPFRFPLPDAYEDQILGELVPPEV